MKEYLLILKGDGMDHLSPEEMQQIFGAYKTWVNDLGEKYLAGQRLQSIGSLIGQDRAIKTDGPFLEAKEIIAGYFMILAADHDEANKIALSSPHLPYYSIEVRPLVQPLMH